MKICLLGSEGFIGTHFRKIVPNVYRYDLVLGDDIRDTFKLDTVFEKERFDVVINMAARAGVRLGEEHYEEYFSTNCIGLQNVIKACEKYGVKKFVHLSSSSKIEAKSIYGVTKLTGDCLVRNSNLDYSLITPFTVIGEGGRKEMVLEKWKNQILKGENVTFYGDGTSFRGYTYVEDFVKGVLLSISAPKGEYNLGGDQKVTLEELWEIFKEVYPQAERTMLPMPEYDECGQLADTSKSYEIMEWKHTTDIKKKIKELIQ